MYYTLAYLTAGLHFLGLAYMVFGGFLAWRWPKSIFVHLPFAFWGLLVMLGVNPQHPLTWVENEFRIHAGLGPMPEGFNQYYIFGPMLPEHLEQNTMVIASILVLVSYGGALIAWLLTRRTGTSGQALHEW